MRWLCLGVILVSGCGSAGPTEPIAAEPTPAPVPAPPAADLYAACRDRVELPESAGECASDADCAPVGCSSEVCTSRSAGADLMTTCDVQDCFAVLGTCGCREGVCAWSVAGAAGG